MGYFGSEFTVLCNHYGVMAAWSRKTLKMFENFLRFFGKKRPITVQFSRFFSENFHRDTDQCVVFKFREISPGSPAVTAARIVPKICRGQPPTMYSEYSRFHSNRFTFGGVIAKRVHTAKTRREMNPIFGWSLPSSRITMTMPFPRHSKLFVTRSSAIAEGPRDTLCCKFVLLHEVWELKRFQTAKLTLKVIQGHWQWCHLIDHTRFPISVRLQLCPYLALLTKFYHLFL